MRESFSLFYSFFKIGLFTFGGGYAMIPLVQREVVRKGYLSAIGSKGIGALRCRYSGLFFPRL